MKKYILSYFNKSASRGSSKLTIPLSPSSRREWIEIMVLTLTKMQSSVSSAEKDLLPILKLLLLQRYLMFRLMSFCLDERIKIFIVNCIIQQTHIQKKPQLIRFVSTAVIYFSLFLQQGHFLGSNSKGE